jgi:hypothetical protein
MLDRARHAYAKRGFALAGFQQSDYALARDSCQQRAQASASDRELVCRKNYDNLCALALRINKPKPGENEGAAAKLHE